MNLCFIYYINVFILYTKLFYTTKITFYKMIKIGYNGYVRRQNLGDEAMYIAIKALLKKHVKVPYKIIGKFIFDEKEKFDLYICGGGTLLSGWASVYDKQLNTMIKKKIPCVIFGTGVQELDFHWLKNKVTREKKNLLKYNVNNSRFVGVRGYRSRKTLLKVGSNPRKVELIGDPAFWCFEAKRKIKYFNNNKPTISVNIGSGGQVIFGNEKKFHKKFTECMKYLLEQNFNLLFYPVYQKDIPYQKKIVKALLPHIKRKNQLKSLEKTLDVPSTIKLIKQTDFSVCMKLHSIVFSAVAATPFLAFEYRPKCREFAESVNCGDYVIRTSSLNISNFKKVFNSAWKKKKKKHKILIKKRDYYRKKLNNFAKKVANLVNS